MTVYLANAFSLNMLRFEESVSVEIRKATIDEVKKLLSKGFVSAIGHESTAKFLTKKLGIEVPVNRVAITLGLEDELIVAQIKQRLPEGKVLSEEELEKVPVEFYHVEITQIDDHLKYPPY